MPNNLTDWASFGFEIRYDRDAIRNELVNIEAYRLSLNQLILPQEWRVELQSLFIVRSVHGTTAIEGNPLPEDEVARQLTAKRPRPARDQVHRQTQNAHRAFKWIESEFGNPRPLWTEAIHRIHELLTEGSDEGDNVPGQLRQSGHNVTVGSPQFGGVHRPPPGGPLLARLLEQYVAFIHSPSFKAENIVVQALIAHLYFVTLHPFGNGNGRTTRCIEAAILFGGGYNTHGFYSLSNFFYRNRDEYFRMLQETRTEHRYDLTAFLRFGLRGFREELERINAYVRNRTHRLHYREMIRRCVQKRVGPRRRLLNAREESVLHGILDITKPANPFSDESAREATWDDLWRICKPLYAGKTPRTLARELVRLEGLGLIEGRGSAGRDDFRVTINFQAIGRY